MRLNDKHYYNYFVDSTLKILNLLGDKSSRQDIEDKIKEDNFYLCFPNFKNSKWWLGIWPVGDWNFEDEYDGEVYKSGYGISNYNPHTIIVFLIHKWDLDKFRPTYSNWEMCISDNNDYELGNAVKTVQQFINNPLDSYYRTLDVNYEGNNEHKNKYTAYIEGMWKNEIYPVIHKYARRFGGWFGTTVIKTMTMLDRRVHSMETKYHSDKWNAEFESALVFYYGDTPWKSWKRYNDYSRIATFFRKLCDYNLFINMTYVDKDKEPENKWRCVYWEGIPEKDDVYEDDVEEKND